MTTKPKARKFRIRRPGEARSAAPEPERSASAGPDPREPAPGPRTDDGFGSEPFPTAAARSAAGTPPPSAPAAPRVTVTTGPAGATQGIDGMTTRQLRMARRLAFRHGMSPATDAEAVQMLRDKGIDPLERRNLLELVVPEQAVAATAEKVKTAVGATRAGVPQTVPEAAPNLPARPEDAPPPDPVAEILAIQRDIMLRRRRRVFMLAARLSAFVLLPTLIAAIYFFVIATPMYATKSEFVIQQADGPGTGPAGGLLGAAGLGGGSQDSITVQSYLQSRESMLRLEEDIGFKAHFSQDWIDPIQRLDPGATNEEAYRHYTKHVKIGFDPTEGIVKMEVIAADPEVSAAFSRALIAYAEEQVDKLSLRLREDQMQGAMETFAAAEARMVEAQDRILMLQEQLGVLDPASESATVMQQIAGFETQLAEKRLQLEQLLDNAAPNQARVAGTRGDIERLEALISDLRRQLTDASGAQGSLARISAELQMAQVDLETRTMMMQESLQQLEAARIEANRQVRYLSTGVNPIPPDEPTYPRALEDTLLTFFVFAGLYLLVSLTVSVLREQVSG